MPAAARGFGSDSVSTGHGCDGTTTTDEASSKVFSDGIGIVRLGDDDAVHTYPSGGGCVPHTVSLSSASTKVFIEGLGAGREGDSYGSEVITSGSQKVFIGG